MANVSGVACRRLENEANQPDPCFFYKIGPCGLDGAQVTLVDGTYGGGSSNLSASNLKKLLYSIVNLALLLFQSSSTAFGLNQKMNTYSKHIKMIMLSDSLR